MPLVEFELQRGSAAAHAVRLQLRPNKVHRVIGQDRQEEVALNPFILAMADRPEPPTLTSAADARNFGFVGQTDPCSEIKKSPRALGYVPQ